jgi:ParB family chromosome partitioning protein
VKKNVKKSGQKSGKKRGLGRGLSTLIGDADLSPDVLADRPPESVTTPAPDGTGSGGSAGSPEALGYKMVGVAELGPGTFQPRQQFDEKKLAELSKSLKEKGVLQPILVRPVTRKSGKKAGPTSPDYEIVAGERRWRAAQKARLHEIPVIIRELDDTDALQIAIIENVQRADLNPVEEAEAYQRLMDEFDYTQEVLAKELGKSRSHIANTLRLTGVSKAIRTLLMEQKLSAGHARALIGHPDADRLAKEIVHQGLSVRAAERLAAGKSDSQSAAKNTRTVSPAIEKDADTRALEKTISDTLGLSVSITHKGESGKLEVSYKSLEQLDEVARRLMGSAPGK